MNNKTTEQGEQLTVHAPVEAGGHVCDGGGVAGAPETLGVGHGRQDADGVGQGEEQHHTSHTHLGRRRRRKKKQLKVLHRPNWFDPSQSYVIY